MKKSENRPPQGGRGKESAISTIVVENLRQLFTRAPTPYNSAHKAQDCQQHGSSFWFGSWGELTSKDSARRAVRNASKRD